MSWTSPADPHAPALSPRAWAVVAYAAIVSTVGAALYLTRFYTFEGERIGVGRALAWQACIYASWAALVPLLAWLGRRVHLGDRSWRATAVAYASASLVVVPAHAAFTAWATWLLRPHGPGVRPALRAAFGPLLVERLPVDLLGYWAIVGVLVAASYHAAMLRRAREAGQLEAALARAELHALRAQLEPHFLFNALQGISALIPRDPALAQRMTARLGDLLRRTLRESGATEVTLREELELLEHYLAIEQVRFGDRLRVEYDVATEALDCLVPDLLLQPLAENAVRHGIGGAERGGTLRVAARCLDGELELRVSDDGAGLPAGWNAMTHAGVGLSLTYQRARQAGGGRGAMEVTTGDAGGTVARVVLPARRRAPAAP